jgi:hypothetical protein
MTASTNPAAAEPIRSRAASIAEDGLFAGALGALTVAVFFLVVDVFEGRPLFTPSLLGSVLFLRQSAEAVGSVDIPMVFAYTGVHFAVFVAVGMAAAFMVSEFEANPPVGLVLLLLFICFEAGFFGVTVGIAPGVIGVLGAWLVGIANLLAAAAMAAYLLWWSHPEAFRNLDRLWQDGGPD